MSIRRLGFLVPNKTLFLLCDVQEKFRFMGFFKEFSKNVEKLVTCGKILDVPLVVTEQNPEKLGKTIAELDVAHAKGVFAKTKFSMCIPEMGKVLDSYAKNVESIVIFGLETHICIDQTCLDLLDTRKYEVHVVADCVLSRSSVDRDLALDRLRTAGCIITTSESVIFKLLRDKEHPRFNEVRKLVTEPSLDTGLRNKL